MPRVLASSVEVLDSATSMTSQIDAVLGSADSDYDWSPDIPWWPGDPLYERPYYYTDDNGYTQIQGNYARPMIQLISFDDTMDSHEERYLDCKDCMVSGSIEETKCWMCGGPVSRTTRFAKTFMSDFYDVASPERMTLPRLDFSPMTQAMNETAESWRAANEAFRRMSQQLITYSAMDVRLSSRTAVSRGGYVLGRSIFDEAFRVDMEERPERRRISVSQAAVDTIQELPDLLRRYSSGMPSDRPRTLQEHARVAMPPLSDLPSFLVVTDLELPTETPDSYIPPAEYTASEGVDYLIRRELVEEPAYVRFLQSNNRLTRDI